MESVDSLLNSLEATDFLTNPQARRAASYEPPAGLGIEAARRAHQAIRACPAYAPTPFYSLEKAAQSAGLAAIYYKDEGPRFGLKSFKSLGGAYAVGRLLQKLIREESGRDLSLAEIIGGAAKDSVGRVSVTTATDGNHGRAVAAGARLFGCRAVILLPAGVSPAREAALRDLGAEVRRLEGNYDDSVAQAFRLAEQDGWYLVSDTSRDDYQEIPRQVMAGYGVMMEEMRDQIAAFEDGGFGSLSHVFLQGGVGSFAASIAAYLAEALAAKRPRIVIVEPRRAACLLESARAGAPRRVGGSLETVMAGLACGEVASLAWEVLHELADVFLSLPDDGVAPLMSALGRGHLGPPIESGESGVVGLLGVFSLLANPDTARRAGLGPDSRVLVFGTEGASDPEIYRRLTGLEPVPAQNPFTDAG